MQPGSERPLSRARCEWATGDPLLTKYHDFEWGTPENDERRLFEFLVLEGARAGLSRGAYPVSPSSAAAPAPPVQPAESIPAEPSSSGEPDFESL